MHHRSRHPNSGGGGNPFTGRRLPANSPYRQQHNDNHNQSSSQPNINGMAKKALLIISSFCIFFYIVSGSSSGVDEQQYTGGSVKSSSESQYTKDLNDMKKKKQRKIQQKSDGVQKVPTKLVLPPNDSVSVGNTDRDYDTFNINHDSMNLDESHLGYETDTHNTEKYQHSNQFNEFNVDVSKSRSSGSNAVDESDRSNDNNSYRDNDAYPERAGLLKIQHDEFQNNNRYIDNGDNSRYDNSGGGGRYDNIMGNNDSSQSDNLSTDGEAPPSKEDEGSNSNSRSSVLDNTVGDESYRHEDKSNAFGDTDDNQGGGLRGKNKSRSNYKKNDSDNQFGRVVSRSPMDNTTGDRYASDRTKVLKRGYDDTDEKENSSNSDGGEEDNSNIVFPKSSDVGDGAFYKHQDQMAIPRLIESGNNNSKSDETSRESTYMEKRHDFQTNVSGDVKKYLQSMNEQNEQSETGKVVSSDDNSDETNKEVDEDTTYEKQSDDLTKKDRYSSVKRRSNTYKHKSVGDEDLYKEQKHGTKEVDGVSSDDVADKDDQYSSTKKRMSDDTYSKKDRFDEARFDRQTEKRSHSVQDKYAKSPSASHDENKLTEYRRDNHMQDDSKEKEEKSLVGEKYPGSEEDLKRYASFDKHLLNGIDEVTDNTALGKRKHSTQKQFDDLTAISNKASSLIESDYPEEKHMLKDSAEDEESVQSSNRVEGLHEMNDSPYKKKLTKAVEDTELFYESRTRKEIGKSSDNDVKASDSGDISQNDKHAQGLEGLNTMRVFNDMGKSDSEDTANTRYRKPMDTKDLDDSDISKKSGSAASSDNKPDESEYVSSKKSIPSASHVMDKPEEEEYTTKDYPEKKAQSGDEVLSNVDESAYNREYPRNSHSTDEKESTFDQAAEEQREPIDGSGNSGDDSRVNKKYGSRSKKYDESEEKDTDKEKDTDLINSDTAPKLEALSFSKKNVSLDDKYNDSDKASRLNDRYYGDKKQKYSTFKQTEGIITADEDSKSKDDENVATEIGDYARESRYPIKRRSPSTSQQAEDRKVDDVSGSSDTKKVMDVEDNEKDNELRFKTREEQTLSKGSQDEDSGLSIARRMSSGESKPSADSKDLVKDKDVSKDLLKASKSYDDKEKKEVETEENTVLLSRLRKKKAYDTEGASDDDKEKVSESNSIESEEVKSPLSKLRLKKKTASYAPEVSNESGDDAVRVENDIDSSALVKKNSKSENSNEDATEKTDGLLSNLQIKKKLAEEEKSGYAEGETKKGNSGSSQDEPNIVLDEEEESTSIKKEKRYRDF